MRRVAIFLGVLYAGGQSAALAESAPCGSSGSPRVERYFKVVDRYRQSEYEDALAELRHLPTATPSRVIHELTPENVPSDDCLQAAVLLHTDFAMSDEESGRGRLAPIHWRTARRFIDRMQDVERREALRRNWLLMVAYYFQTTIFAGNTRSGYDRAKRYFDEAVASFPDDADVLVSAGTLYEWNGTLPRGLKTDLNRAESLYRRAVIARPNSAEARLRLGRSLIKQERHQEAETPLRDVLTIDENAFWSYYAHLFLGRLSEKAGGVPEAIEHYRSAMHLLPHWQVAYIALAHALRVSGDRDEARAILNRGVTMRPPFAQLDGWWVYERGRCGRWLPLLKRLREEVAL